MLVVILSIFLLAILAPRMWAALREATGWLLGFLFLVLTAGFAILLPKVSKGPVLESTPWVPSLDIHLTFRLDGLSILFLLLISGIGALIFIYSSGYLHGQRNQGRYFAYMLLFTGAMLGLVTADNLIILYVFWELTSVASYLLIGFKQEQDKARSAALQALLVTSSGGLAMLAGFILLGRIGGSYSISQLLESGEAVRNHSLYVPALLLVLLGAFTKSAQMPFHFWLPAAMTAPTPVSAFLHSATMVKAGVFLLARLYPILGGTVWWHDLLTLAGVVTMVGGALMALPQTDLKLLLAYSTVSVLGILIFMLGIGTQFSVKAAVVYLVVHSLYKGALFMVAGTLDHGAGSRDVRSLRGLIRVMPVTAVAAGLAALSMSGFPPLLGFIGKELLYEAKLESAAVGPLITIAGVCASMALVAIAIIVGFQPFHGRVRLPAEEAHPPPVSLWLGPAVLAVLSTVGGLFPGLIDSRLVAPAVSAVRAEETTVELKLWHGVNPIFALSVATVLGGVAVYALRRRARRFAGQMAPLAALGPARGYENGLAALKWIAQKQTAVLQHGRLRGYVLTMVAFAIFMTATALFKGETPAFHLDGILLHEAAAGLTVLGAALLVIFANKPVTAVAGIALLGFGVALIYALFGAPDLAITQFLVETLMLFFLVLALCHLPGYHADTRPSRVVFDAVFATLVGVVISALVLSALSAPCPPKMADYYSGTSLRAEGHNVVNVILVDFRALDTLGEITVLAAAGLGVFMLLGNFRPGKANAKTRQKRS